jgi:hypothetical protein
MRLVAIVALCVLSMACITQAQTRARSALVKRLPEVKFKEIAFTDAMEFFRDTSGANLWVDWKALEEIGVSRETPVAVDLRQTPMRVALRTTLESAAPGLLSFYIEDNVITITALARADERMIVRAYPVNDLLVEVPDFEAPTLGLTNNNAARSGGGRGGGGGGGLFENAQDNQNEEISKTRAERGQDLVDLIQTTVRPEIWNINGGKARIKYFSGTLIITAPRSVHEAIGGLME